MKKTLALLTALIIALCSVGFNSCGDEGKSVKINVVDMGKTKKIKGKDGMTVQRLLEQAGISVSGEDEIIPDRGKVWRDAGGTSIKIKRFAKVKVTDGKKTEEVELLGGTVNHAIKVAGFDPDKYKSSADKEAYLTDGMEIKLEKAQDGFVESGDKKYFYKGGELLKDTIVGNDDDGYFYADKDGVISGNCCTAVSQDWVDWNVINSVATMVESEADTTLFYTLKSVAECTNDDMTKEEKLRACFDHLKNDYLEGVRHDPPYYEMDWPILYANDIFMYGKGDCFSYGAAMAFMGKAIGCDECYACNSGGHGWAEIEGLVYDPEWSMHSETEWYAVDYDEPAEVHYKKGLQGGAEWKRIKI